MHAIGFTCQKDLIDLAMDKRQLHSIRGVHACCKIPDAAPLAGYRQVLRRLFMAYLASLLVGKPLLILAVAAVFIATYVIQRRLGFGSDRHPRSLLVVAAAWAVYASWEWLVLIRTPEANIRVDLMLIWPVLLIVTIWFSARALL
jgi:hypothetical protein